MKLIRLAWSLLAIGPRRRFGWAYRSDRPAEKSFAKISSGMIVAARKTVVRSRRSRFRFRRSRPVSTQLPTAGIFRDARGLLGRKR